MKTAPRLNAPALLAMVLLAAPRLSAALVQVDMSGVVQSAFFGAESFLPVGTRLDFRATYETDSTLNPDEDPSSTIGRYALSSLAVSSVGEAGPAVSNRAIVQNDVTDAVQFTLGFGQLPPAGGFAFNSAFLSLQDPSGIALPSDALPPSLTSFRNGSFSLRWGGADGPAVGGMLAPVPEPALVLLLLGSALVLSDRARRR